MNALDFRHSTNSDLFMLGSDVYEYPGTVFGFGQKAMYSYGRIDLVPPGATEFGTILEQRSLFSLQLDVTTMPASPHRQIFSN